MSLLHQFVAHGKPVTRHPEPQTNSAEKPLVSKRDAAAALVLSSVADRILELTARVESLEARLDALEPRFAMGPDGLGDLVTRNAEPVTVTRAVTGEVTLGNAVTVTEAGAVTRNAKKQAAYRARKKGNG